MREVGKLVAFAELLIALDEIRAGSQISKAELARRIGVKPSVVSRLLDGKGRHARCRCLPAGLAVRLPRPTRYRSSALRIVEDGMLADS